VRGGFRVTVSGGGTVSRVLLLTLLLLLLLLLLLFFDIASSAAAAAAAAAPAAAVSALYCESCSFAAASPDLLGTKENILGLHWTIISS